MRDYVQLTGKYVVKELIGLRKNVTTSTTCKPSPCTGSSPPSSTVVAVVVVGGSSGGGSEGGGGGGGREAGGRNRARGPPCAATG